jgi:hypothetical protein
MMKKRILSMLLALTLLVGLLPYQAKAADVKSGTCGDRTIWTLADGVLTISGTGPMWDYGADGQGPWGRGKNGIYAVVIESGVTRVGANAFSNLKDLTSVTFSDTVTEIGWGAFDTCVSLRSIVLPAGITKLETLTFNLVPLTSIVIPEGVVSLGGMCFLNCKLDSITLPTTLESISKDAFMFGSVNTVYYGGSMAQWQKVAVMSEKVTKADIYFDSYNIPTPFGDVSGTSFCFTRQCGPWPRASPQAPRSSHFPPIMSVRENKW